MNTAELATEILTSRVNDSQKDIDPIRLARQKVEASTDPIVWGILDKLCLEESTAAEIADGLGAPVEAVRRQLRKLARVGLVSRSGKTRRRGVSEYLYTRDLDNIRIGPAEPRQLEEMGARLLRKIVGETSEAVRAGTYGSRPDSAAVHLSIAVDEPGLARMARVHHQLLDEIVATVGRAKSRLQGEGGERIEAEVALILVPVETSAWSRRLADGSGAEVPNGRLSHRHPVDRHATIQDTVRARIIAALTLAPLSAKEIAELTALSAERTRSELKRLLDLGAVAVHDHRQRRGTREYRYVCRNRSFVMSLEEVASYDGRRLDGYRRQVLRRVFDEALDSIRSGMFARFGEDHHLSRIPMRLDAQAYQEISESIERAVEQLIRLKELGLERTGGDHPPPLVATSGMLLFERAPDQIR